MSNKKTKTEKECPELTYPIARGARRKSPLPTPRGLGTLVLERIWYNTVTIKIEDHGSTGVKVKRATVRVER
jgi:hypothetical protein